MVTSGIFTYNIYTSRGRFVKSNDDWEMAVIEANKIDGYVEPSEVGHTPEKREGCPKCGFIEGNNIDCPKCFHGQI